MNGKVKLFFQYLCLAIKIILFFWIFFPVFFSFFVISKIKSKRFLRKDKILNYLNNHRNEIKGLGNSRISNLEVEKIRKGVSNLVWKQTFSFDGNKKIILVGKKFLPFGSIITFVSAYLGPSPTRIPMSINSRFRQEVDALNSLRRDSVYAPEVVFSDDREKLILMKYIPGTDSGDFLEQVASLGKIDRYILNFFQNCGEGLALLHRNGISLVGHNDRSRILREDDGHIYFVDFELSTSTDYRAWDLAIFMHWIRIKLGLMDRQEIGKLEGAFVEGYKTLGSLNHKDIKRHLESLRIYIPFAKIGTWINRKRKQRLIRN